MDSKNKNMLLALLGLLLAMKFLFVPWLDYLEEQRLELATLTKKLTRSEALLQVADQVQSNQQTITRASETLLATLAATPDAAAYRIAFQQQLQTTAESMAVQLVLFDWVSDIDLQGFNAHRGRVSVRVSGELVNLARLHLALEQRMPHLHIRELKIATPSSLQLGDRVEMAGIIDVDYRVVSQP